MAKTIGIAIGKDVPLVNPQKLWDRGVRFVITEGSADNGMLRKVKGQCEYQGFKFGVYHVLRYPPMPGTAKTQVAEFNQAMIGITTDLPITLNLSPVPGFPIPPNKTYQDSANIWLQDLLSYLKGADRMVRVDSKLVVNLTGATGPLVDENIPLWIHQPSAGDVVTKPYRPTYVLRSYGARDWDSNLVQPIEFAGDMVLFNSWIEDGKQTVSYGFYPASAVPPTPPVPVTPPTDVTSTKAKLDEIIRLATELKASL